MLADRERVQSDILFQDAQSGNPGADQITFQISGTTAPGTPRTRRLTPLMIVRRTSIIKKCHPALIHGGFLSWPSKYPEANETLNSTRPDQIDFQKRAGRLRLLSQSAPPVFFFVRVQSSLALYPAQSFSRKGIVPPAAVSMRRCHSRYPIPNAPRCPREVFASVFPRYSLEALRARHSFPRGVKKRNEVRFDLTCPPSYTIILKKIHFIDIIKINVYNSENQILNKRRETTPEFKN